MSVYYPKYVPAFKLPVEFTVDVDRYQFISLLGSPTTAGELAKGITEMAATDGDRGSVVSHGTAILTIREAVEAGDMIASNANGFGVKAAQGDFVNAIAIEAGSIGADIEVQLMPFYLGSPWAAAE